MTLNFRLPHIAPALLCLGATVASAETLLVTTLSLTGNGSLQAALDTAGASAAPTVILLTETGEIVTPTGLTYSGPSPLTIYGNGVTIVSPENVTLFIAQNAGALSLTDIAFVGPGGFDIEARGDANGPGGRGIVMDIAANANGNASLALTNVSVTGVAGHGIHITDCAQVADCGGEGSAASVVVDLTGVTIFDVGFGTHDADGFRVDERGPGNIAVSGMFVDITTVGGDGMELDEAQAGDVRVDLIHSSFMENGAYCDPATLAPHMPNPAEGSFREFEIIVADLPQPGPDTPDLACIELEADVFEGGSVEEYEYTIDVEDGLDIDEAGPGSIIATFSASDMFGNYDEGFDLDEAGPGDIDVVFTGVTGNGNLDTAIKLSEAGPGSIYVTATAIEASSNGAEGLVAEEEDGGDLFMALIASAFSGNDGGELGIEAVQDGEGAGEVYVIDSEIADGIETDGVTLDAD